MTLTLTERHEINQTIEAVVEAALSLGLKLANGKPPWELLAGVEHVQERLNKARAALGPVSEPLGEIGTTQEVKP